MATIKAQLDEIGQIAEGQGIRLPDRKVLLDWMSSEVNELSFRVQADYFMVHLDPVLGTTTGTRAYRLPANFPANFVRHAGQRYGRLAPTLGSDTWCCKLDDATNESLLDYESPTQFYSRNLRAEANGKPIVYTVVSTPNGAKDLLLSPPPDASTYTVDGLYIPTDWKLKEVDAMPPFPNNSAILRYAVLRRLAPQYEAMFQEARMDLVLKAAQNRAAQFIPFLGRTNRNENTAMRRS